MTLGNSWACGALAARCAVAILFSGAVYAIAYLAPVEPPGWLLSGAAIIAWATTVTSWRDVRSWSRNLAFLLAAILLWLVLASSVKIYGAHLSDIGLALLLTVHAYRALAPPVTSLRAAPA